MDKMKHRRLQELDRSDFEVADGQPDIRGWDVKNTSGRKIGEVEELVIDAQQKKVRYMVVDLDDNEIGLDHRKVIIPIGLAELHKEDDDVILPAVQPAQLRELPEYDRDRLDPDMERTTCAILGNARAAGEEEGELYRHAYYNDDNLYRHRFQQANRTEESEYERGLRLWERRSLGGIIAGESGNKDITGRDSRTGIEDNEPGRQRQSEEARREIVRERRARYEQRTNRSRSNDGDRGRHGSIEQRIREEGLRDPDDV